MFGAAAVSGPGAAAKTLADLQVPGVGAVAALAGTGGYPGPASTDNSWAVARLAKAKLMTALHLEQKRRTFHIHSLDVDTAALRSVSLAAKIRISQEKQFKESLKNEMNMLERIIAGVEDY